MTTHWTRLLLTTFMASALGLGACMSAGDARDGAGVVDPSERPLGPRIVFDALARPVPEVPFPSDLLLTPTDETATGTRWNISEQAPTQLERTLRKMLNQLDAFGPMAPISLSFQSPIDPSTVTPDTVMLVNVEPGHPGEGQLVPLELGERHFPPEMEKPTSYWGWDKHAELPDLLFGADNEAILEPGGEPRRINFYEVESHTLILRPLEPLAPGARHAVIITRGVKGPAFEVDGEPAFDEEGQRLSAPVRSPFVYKAHAAQVDGVERALDLLDMPASELAFGWTYVASDVIDPFERFREGLYGDGPLARMGDVPAAITEVRDTDVTHDADGVKYEADPRDHRYILQPGIINELLGIIADAEPSLSAQLNHVDYLVFGSFSSPDLRTGERKTIGVNPFTGEGEVRTASVPFVAGVPLATERFQPPFPVVVYFHGTNTSRLEVLGVMDALARQGIASIAFDEVAHGPIIPDIPLLLEENGVDPAIIAIVAPVLADILVPDRFEEFEGLEPTEALEKLKDVGLFAEFAAIGRAEDEDGDGRASSGEAFFHADPFRQCAGFQQDLVDAMQLVRLIRGLGTSGLPPAIADPGAASEQALMPSLLAGDFNADGVLDFGGPDVPIGMAGTSLGGFHAVMAAAVEPEVRTVTPIAGGGGLPDIILRSGLRDVVQGLMLELFGPRVVGCPDGEGGMWLSLNDDADRCGSEEAPAFSFAHLAGAAAAGGQVRLVNRDNGEHAEATFAPGNGFSLAAAADQWDRLEVTVEAGDQRWVVPIETPYEGLGFERNTPDFRRFLGIGQNVLDRCDPLTFSRALFLNPRPGRTPVNILFENGIGDFTVPFSTGVNLARVSGALGDRARWEPIVAELKARGAYFGDSSWDIDDILRDNPPEMPPLGPLEPVDTGAGVASIRFADVDGDHEWIVATTKDALDHATLSQNRIALFHWSGGRIIVDDPCIAEDDCPLLDDPTPLLDAAK